jgi:hypothetical protein
VDEEGRFRPEIFTPTGYVDNHFTVGPAILWSPFFLAAHFGVLAANALGASIPADGYSRPYVWAMGLSTALYGFLGLWLAFRIAREYFEERWAFLATLGIWAASSLPVYMYFNPSWSHAHSAFAVALFLWYWNRTRGPRSPLQWILLGLLAGLMMNVYYPNAVVLVVPLLESVQSAWERFFLAKDRWAALGRLLAGNLIFGVAALMAFLPTLFTRVILYGSPFRAGYPSLTEWNWTSPEWWNVLFSANHGLMSWTPVLVFAVLGLVLLARRDRELSIFLAGTFLAFYYLIASYATWHGISSYGNRFFVSLTPLFVVGLAAALHWLGERGKGWLGAPALLLLAAWNAGLIFQWGTFLIPPRGPISWKQAARNQVTVVPARLWSSMRAYLIERRDLMQKIEQGDLEKLKGQKP